MVDIPGNNTTTQSIAVGGTLDDTLEIVGDRDWVRIELTAGQSISVFLDGLTLEDPYLRIRDAAGNILYENDDIVSGTNRDSLLAFTATTTGTYFIEVGAWEDNYTGTYQLSVSVYQPPALATVDQIADQLVTGFWGGEQQRFNVSQGGSLTVNLTALTTEGRQLARAALTSWSDIIGVSFVEVTSGGQITFDDNEEGAFSDSIVSEGFISSSEVNVSAQWLADYGSSLSSYSFETYIHEIGHALGLGHAGNYNGEARYPFDARFQNDSTAMSIMSYFDQQENTYFAGLGFTKSLVGTPMLADIAAMSRLYGLSTITRVGDTVYGFDSTANNPVFDASLNLNLAYSIFDSGGLDTLNYSQTSLAQRINLNPETFSDVGGAVGNVSIARGVVIENVIAGSGHDLVIGNGANNVLNGGDGNDTVSYETASVGVTVNLALGGAQNTIGAGTDTLVNFEQLVGSDFGDTLTGGTGLTTIRAGRGNDTLVSSADGDQLYGEAGDDLFISGVANSSIDGGEGFDTVDFSTASGAINAGTPSLSNIERIIGSNFDDQFAFTAVMIGGNGNDVYTIYSGHQVVETAGQGIDLVQSYVHYILPENVENLSLHFDANAGASIAPEAAIDGAGNSLDNLLTGSKGANQLSGMAGSDTLTGGAGIDTLIGGTGDDTFRDSVEGLNGDTIADFSRGDRINFVNANLAGFSFSLSGSTLTYTGGSLTLTGVSGTLVASAAAGGGVQLSLQAAANDARNDFNGDGRSDILWRHVGNGDVVDWLGQSNGSFAGNGSSYNNASPAWAIAGTGDFNGDGRDDILWRNANSGEVVDWLGQTNGSFVGNAASFNNASKAWHIVGIGDFNGDQRDDVLWRNDDGLITSWLGQANGSFSGTAKTYNAAGSWQVAGTGDFNGDGRDDVLWRNLVNGDVVNWLGQADGSFAGNAAAFNNANLSWQLIGAGDFNGDGRDDVLWRNDDGTITNWLGQANGSFAGNPNAENDVSSNWHVVGIGDYDGNDRDDILWRSDGGLVTNWLGQANGSFAGNPNALSDVDGAWHIQPYDLF